MRNNPQSYDIIRNNPQSYDIMGTYPCLRNTSDEIFLFQVLASDLLLLSREIYLHVSGFV